MKIPRVPAGLIAAGVFSGAGGIALAGQGAKQFDDARKQREAADERYQARLDESARRRADTNERIQALGRLQEECRVVVVGRMRDFLRRHEKQVRDSDRLLVDGIEVTTRLLEGPRGHGAADAGAWVTGAAGSVLAGAGTGAAVNKLANNYGVAGTGRRISTLAGAAKERAAKAFLGGGPKAMGGGGMALGNTVQKFVTVGPSLLAAGLVTIRMGMKAMEDAHARETQIAVWCAEIDLADGRLTAIDQRAEELTELLNGLRPAAKVELDKLESVPFDPEKHVAQLQKTMMLVLAVRDVAATPLLTPQRDLEEHSETLIVKYRPMTKETEGD